MSERFLVPLAVFFAVLAGTVFPILRAYRKTGATGTTIHKRRNGVERLVGALAGLLGGLLVVWAVLLAVFGAEALGVWARPDWAAWIGWLLFCAGLITVVTAQAQMGEAWRIGIDKGPTPLVTEGLYRFVRNPIYVGMMLMGAAMFALTPARWTLAGWLAYVAVINMQTRYEERHLAALHGEPYRRYLLRVGRFIPRPGTPE